MKYLCFARTPRWLILLAVVGLCPRSLADNWKRHLVVNAGHCNTAVALDANNDRVMDVIASYNGTVTLLLAPDWSRQVVLHRFARPGSSCIHSAVLDVDGDGDMDWAGAVANGHPFWLENPGPKKALHGAWAARTIDPVITGIHCLRVADIDNDGKDDLIVNNFAPDKGIADSIAWLRVPEHPETADAWHRSVFANGDARGGSHYMGAADIDGDGWKEIAVGAKGSPFADGNWFAYWKHPGPKLMYGPWKKNVLAKNQVGATNILGADMDGDGRTDWVASRGHGVGVIWMRNPDWQIHDIDPHIRSPHSLVVADFDNDGDTDVASCGFESEVVRIYLNDGNGRFSVNTLDEGQQSYHLSVADMDADGDLDVLNAGRSSNNVVWYENPTR